MAIARFPGFVIDCPDPAALATFYGALMEWKVTVSADWAEIRSEDGQCISFQQVEAYTPPAWPGQEVPQQMHLDVIVDASTPPRRPCSGSAPSSTSTNPAHPSGCFSTRPGTRSVSAWTDSAADRYLRLRG